MQDPWYSKIKHSQKNECRLLVNHTVVNETGLLRVCNGKGQTHSYIKRAEAVTDPALSLSSPGCPLMLSENQSKSASMLSLVVYQWTHSTSDHAQRACPPKADWLNGFPQQQVEKEVQAHTVQYLSLL